MFAQRVFTLLSRLISSRWAHDYEAHYGAYEDAYVARIGPLHLEVNRCIVLDHDDAYMSIRIPVPLRRAQALNQANRGSWGWGQLHLGYGVCLGEDVIRQPGFYVRWQKPLPAIAPGESRLPESSDDFPF